MKPSTIIYANIPTVIFLVFSAYTLNSGHTGVGITAFIMALLIATTFQTKN